MNTVDRYIAKSFISGYLILMLVGMGLYALADLLVNIDEFTKDPDLPLPAALMNIYDYYLAQLPLYFSQLAGPLMTIAASFTLAVMLRNNELIALISSGVPLQRLTAPLLICSIFMITLWAVNQELILPKVAHKIVRKRDDAKGTAAVGVYWARDDRNNLMIALRMYPREKRLYDVIIVEADAGGRPANLIKADRADYDELKQTWVLERGIRIRAEVADAPRDLPLPITLEPVADFAFGLTPEQLVVRQKSEYAAMLSLGQMNELIASGRIANRAGIVMSRHIRLTQPLLQLILLTLVVPFFLVREPVSVLATGGLALAVGGIFFGVTFVAHSIVSDHSAALVAWMPILLFGPFAVWRLGDLKT